MKYFLLWKILPFLISISVFVSIIYLSPPPPNWHQAPLFQIIIVLISLLAVLIFFYNFLLSKFRYNIIISLATLVMIFLHSLQELDLYSGTVVTVAGVALILVLSDFKLLKLPQPKPLERQPHPPSAPQDRVKRLRRLAYLTTRKK